MSDDPKSFIKDITWDTLDTNSTRHAARENSHSNNDFRSNGNNKPSESRGVRCRSKVNAYEPETEIDIDNIWDSDDDDFSEHKEPSHEKRYLDKGFRSNGNNNSSESRDFRSWAKNVDEPESEINGDETWDSVDKNSFGQEEPSYQTKRFEKRDYVRNGRNFSNFRNKNFSEDNLGSRNYPRNDFNSNGPRNRFDSNSNGPRNRFDSYFGNTFGRGFRNENIPKETFKSRNEAGPPNRFRSNKSFDVDTHMDDMKDADNVDSRPTKQYIPPTTDVEKLFEEWTIRAGSHFETLVSSANCTTTCKGRQVSIDPVKSFTDLNILPQLLSNVAKCGFEEVTPVQGYALRIIADGCDAMFCAQTGTGKTAAYLLPIISSLIASGDDENFDFAYSPSCIVLVPTRELAVQVLNEARKLSFDTDFHPCVAYGGVPMFHQKRNFRNASGLLVSTTGRLKHFIRNGDISLKKVKYLVLDEADRMLDLGFERDIRSICDDPEIPSVTSGRQTLMFSATFPDDVRKLATKYLKEDFYMVAVDTLCSANRCIRQAFIDTHRSEKKEELLKLLNIDLDCYKPRDGKIFKQKTLVFVESKKLADILGAVLCQAGLPSTTIHGDRYQDQRELALSDFRCGNCAVLIATAVASRGLDIRGVDHVINYDLPNSGQEYVHRIGRTGRVGNEGRATSFYDSSVDCHLAPSLVNILSEVQQEIPEFILQDAKMTSF